MHHTFSVLDVCVCSGDTKILFASMSGWSRRTSKSVSSPTKIVCLVCVDATVVCTSASCLALSNTCFIFLICHELIFLGLNEHITSEVHCNPWTSPCSYQMYSIFCWRFIGVYIKNNKNIKNSSAISLFHMINIHLTHIIIYGSRGHGRRWSSAPPSRTYWTSLLGSCCDSWMDFHKALAKTGLFGCKGREDDSNSAEGKQ